MKFAVIGNPITHSLSPEIHQAFAASLDIELTYTKLFADHDKFDNVAHDFFINDGIGLNVTAPFKADAFRFVSEVNDMATAAQAVNTIHADQGKLIGYNTDGLGLVTDLIRLDWLKEGSKTLIIGAGGAAQGIIQPLLDQNLELTVANRTKQRAESLRTQFPRISTCGLSEISKTWDIVINATAAGWQGNQLAVSKDAFEGSHCYDLGYQRDGKTPFVLQVEKVAALSSDGLGMLVEQAAEAFSIWHGTRPATKSILTGLRNPKRQYIAGAVCPRCQSLDTTYIEKDLLNRVVLRACSACQYTEDVAGNVSLELKL